MSVDISPLYERRQKGEGDACDRKTGSLLHLARAEKTSPLLTGAVGPSSSSTLNLGHRHQFVQVLFGGGHGQGSDQLPLELKIVIFVSFPGTPPNL